MTTPIIKAVAFDVDGTLIDSYMWTQIHALFGFTPEEDKRLFNLYMDGKLTFRDFFVQMSGVFLKKEPLPHKDSVDVALKTFRLMAGAHEVVRGLASRYPLALVSSGFADYVGFVADTLGVPHRYAHTVLTYAPDGSFAGIAFTSEGDELQAKVEDVANFAAKVGAAPTEIAFVGDSVNDLKVFEYTGKGILVGPGTERLKTAAWKQVQSLPEILDIL